LILVAKTAVKEGSSGIFFSAYSCAVCFAAVPTREAALLNALSYFFMAQFYDA
jgi:hypothetical protein